MKWPYHNFIIQTPGEHWLFDQTGRTMASYPAAVAYCCNISSLNVVWTYHWFHEHKRELPDGETETTIASEDSWMGATDFAFTGAPATSQCFEGWDTETGTSLITGKYYPIARASGVSVGYRDDERHYFDLSILPYIHGGAPYIGLDLIMGNTNGIACRSRLWDAGNQFSNYPTRQTIGSITGAGISAPIYFPQFNNPEDTWVATASVTVSVSVGGVSFEPEPSQS